MSTQAQGSEAQTLIGFESNYGETPGSPSMYKVPIITNNVESEQNLNEDETIRDSKNPAKPTRGNINVSGDVEFYIALFGAPTTTDDGDDGLDVEHVYKISSGQPSLFMEKGFTDIASYHVFNGLKVSNFSTEFGGEGDVRGTVSLIGAKETPDTSSIASSPTELAYDKYSQFEASIQEGGSDIAIVTNTSLEIDFDLDDNEENYPIGNQGVRGQLPEGIANITGNLTAWFTDQSLLDKAINGTESSLKFTLTKSSHSLEFYIPEVMF